MRRLAVLVAFLALPNAAGAATARSDARALAAATRAAVHDVNALRRPFHASVVADRRARCGVHFPERVYLDEYDVHRLRTLHAVDDPLRPALAAFAARLAPVHPRDRLLRAGVVAWLRILRPLPAAPSCAALRRWARRGFRRAARPFDAAAADRAVADHNQAFSPTSDAAARLRRLGIPPRLADGFATDGLRAGLESAVPPGPLRDVLTGYDPVGPRVLRLAFSKGFEPIARVEAHGSRRRVAVALEVREPPPYDANGELIAVPLVLQFGCVRVRLGGPLGHRTVVNAATHRRVPRTRCPGLADLGHYP